MDLKTAIQKIENETEQIREKLYLESDHIEKEKYISYLDGLEFALMQIRNIK